MAVLVDEDGTETVGGIQQIRAVFLEAGGGRLKCNRISMSYDHSVGPDHQVLEAAGTVDGKPFEIKSDPTHPSLPLAVLARRLARKILAGEAEGEPT